MHNMNRLVPVAVRADGLLRIGYPDAIPVVEPTLITLAGGVRVWIDAAELGRFPLIEVTDLAASVWALVPLLGEPAYRSLLALSVSEPAGHELTVELDVPTWESLTRVGLLRWLLDYAPVALDEDILRLEIASLAARIADLGFESSAAAYLEKSLPRLVTLLAQAKEGATFPDPVVQLIERGVDIALHDRLVDLDAATAAALREGRMTAYLMRIGRELSQSVPPELLKAWDAAEMTRRPHQLVFRGNHDGAALDVDRVFSVDWIVVPRGVLSTAEGTIRAGWAGGMLTVDVDADLRAAAMNRWSKRLAFRVVAQDGRIRGGAKLSRDASRGVYTGTCPWPDPLRGDERVDVYSIDSPRPPLSLVATHEAAARRAASWALVYERLAGGVDGITALATNAAEAWGDAVAHAAHGRQLSPRSHVARLEESLTGHYAEALRHAGKNRAARRVGRGPSPREFTLVPASVGLSVAEFQLLQPLHPAVRPEA